MRAAGADVVVHLHEEVRVHVLRAPAQKDQAFAAVHPVPFLHSEHDQVVVPAQAHEYNQRIFMTSPMALKSITFKQMSR